MSTTGACAGLLHSSLFNAYGYTSGGGVQVSFVGHQLYLDGGLAVGGTLSSSTTSTWSSGGSGFRNTSYFFAVSPTLPWTHPF
ncbi:MAG: hypothetical protein ACI9VR_001305 [Cognaticolwellia sp.]|jgi:hypothetical protein